MEINLEKNSITLYGKQGKYDVLLKKLIGLSGKDIYQFVTNRGIALPRKIHNLALTSVLNEKIKYLHSCSLTKEYFSRLQHYKDFGETQLVDLFNNICDDADYENYRCNLLNMILLNYEGLKLNDGEIQYLRNLKKVGLETFNEYSQYISASSVESEGTFDGVEIETLKNTLMITSTSQDILDLAEKYGIEIPQHLTKEEYLDFIIHYMNKKEKMTPEIENDLENMTLAGLTTFSRRNGIPLQPSLSKEDYVTYLFYYLDGCEIVHSDIENIIYPKEYEPIEFKIDLSQINIFSDDEAKRLIQFDGDDNEEYVGKINEIIDEYNNPKGNIEEPIIAAPLRPGEKTMADDDGNFELEDFEKEEEKPQEDDKAEETLDDETIQAIIAKDQEEVPKEEEKVEEKIDVSFVVKNEEYGSKKLKELKNGNRKIIVLSSVITVCVLLGALLIYALVR